MRETSPGANMSSRLTSVPVEKAHVFEPALGHALHADDHGVRNFFDRGEEDVRVLRRGVRREAALAAAELQLQRLMAREVLQPVTAQRLGVSDQAWPRSAPCAGRGWAFFAFS